jgi:hypothetical protein
LDTYNAAITAYAAGAVIGDLQAAVAAADTALNAPLGNVELQQNLADATDARNAGVVQRDAYAADVATSWVSATFLLELDIE